MINATQAQQIDTAIGCLRAAKSVLYELRNSDFLAYESDINGDWGKLLVASESTMRLTYMIEQLKTDLIGTDAITDAIDEHRMDIDTDEENMTGEPGFYDC